MLLSWPLRIIVLPIEILREREREREREKCRETDKQSGSNPIKCFGHICGLNFDVM